MYIFIQWPAAQPAPGPEPREQRPKAILHFLNTVPPIVLFQSMSWSRESKDRRR